MSQRFEIDALDPDDPFEVEPGSNHAHLFKHPILKKGRQINLDLSDIRTLYAWGAVLYYPAPLDKGDAHWLMFGEIEGVVVLVPLAPPRSGDPKKCRPIGVYPASEDERKRYFEDR